MKQLWFLWRIFPPFLRGLQMRCFTFHPILRQFHFPANSEKLHLRNFIFPPILRSFIWKVPFPLQLEGKCSIVLSILRPSKDELRFPSNSERLQMRCFTNSILSSRSFLVYHLSLQFLEVLSLPSNSKFHFPSNSEELHFPSNSEAAPFSLQFQGASNEELHFLSKTEAAQFSPNSKELQIRSFTLPQILRQLPSVLRRFTFPSILWQLNFPSIFEELHFPPLLRGFIFPSFSFLFWGVSVPMGASQIYIQDVRARGKDHQPEEIVFCDFWLDKSERSTLRNRVESCWWGTNY